MGDLYLFNVFVDTAARGMMCDARDAGRCVFATNNSDRPSLSTRDATRRDATRGRQQCRIIDGISRRPPRACGRRLRTVRRRNDNAHERCRVCNICRPAGLPPSVAAFVAVAAHLPRCRRPARSAGAMKVGREISRIKRRRGRQERAPG